MKSNIVFALILTSAFILPACRKKISESNTNNNVNVFAVGYVHNAGTNNTATFWKNGQAILLPPATTSTTNSFAYGVAVSGNDVYIMGTNSNGWVYWKNGVPQSITNVSASASSIAVSGNDVYISGTVVIPGTPFTGVAVYWKNGRQINLSQGFKDAGTSAIVLSGNDVYVCGWVLNDGPFRRAMFWKNGNPVFLTDGSIPSNAVSMFIHDNDVYVAGNSNESAVYWKNGQMITLQGGSKPTSAKNVTVVGNDLYVIGSIYNTSKTIPNAVYWKNGQMKLLTDSESQSHATCMAVIAKDVYIGGMVAKPEGTHYHAFEATYWKNGVVTSLLYNGNLDYRYVFGIAVSMK